MRENSHKPGHPESTGVLLINLGTPELPTPSALRVYLKEFLSDPRVVEQPRWLWLPVLHAIILNVRPARSAKLYRKIWTNAGSPLLRSTESLAAKLLDRLSASGNRIHVAVGMRYGQPSIRNGLMQLLDRECRRIVVLPLYPQYSATTTGSTMDALGDVLKTCRNIPDLHFVSRYYDHPDYIEAIAQSIESYWKEHGRPDQLLCSFHGIPERYVRAGDPYPDECQTTVSRLRERLNMNEDTLLIGFQSRFGREPWVGPYTDEILRELGRRHVNRVDVVCPGFSVDCLETLEEIAMENRQLFLDAGGSSFHYIPALNDRDEHVRMLCSILNSRGLAFS
ncbi:MAG: ferrochelatase [Zetaproteobacteria bacterium]|nr:MAG: ferrochelatase [Zetaproteobacteria bacterium]